MGEVVEAGPKAGRLGDFSGRGSGTFHQVVVHANVPISASLTEVGRGVGDEK